MTVRPLRDRRYVVDTEGGTYVVDIERRTCTCPDHAIRGSRCKHLRRVAIEITERRVPAPDERPAVCAVCGRETFVPFDATGAQLCDRHALSPGDLVRDRESGALLLVVRATTERSDEFVTRERRTVAEYETNRHYGGHEPVVEAVYLDADPVGVADVEAAFADIDARRTARDRSTAVRPPDEQRADDGAVVPRESGFGLEGGRPRIRGEPYGFPASRLQPVQRGYLLPHTVDHEADNEPTSVQRSAEV